VVFGLEENNITGQELYNLYDRGLTPTERKYYDCWVKWRSYRKTLPPWRFFNTRGIVKRDHLLMIDQFEAQYEQRMEIKKHKDRVAADQMQFRPFQQQTNNRSNKVQSVL
jgi:hypothetical protein